ncbi:hypothetical protein QNO07_05120 [Streptomyces sp. 549]|uniref:hypothetical protein n=1 Tax=Streptomyces sp. 549 TaxID=3049076 RepID=UPI0024C279C1|nr:hypothetical protein [Streptomyces sp. 549]MDK1472816.1 hypothetical protein [Streptomyces sp. 549]
MAVVCRLVTAAGHTVLAAVDEPHLPVALATALAVFTLTTRLCSRRARAAVGQTVASRSSA